MDEQVKATVSQILTDYLEMNHHRKTHERYAILDAIYSMKGLFTMEELAQYMQDGFPVSRATLYNSMRLFLELRLVMKLNLNAETLYEATYSNRNHCHQVCTVCGNITETRVPELVQAIGKARLKRFKKEAYSMVFYGVCSTCQARISRRKATKTKNNNIKTKK